MALVVLGGTIDALFGSSSTSYNQQSAPLIRPEEFATLKQPILYAYQLGFTRLIKLIGLKITA